MGGGYSSVFSNLIDLSIGGYTPASQNFPPCTVMVVNFRRAHSHGLPGLKIRD